MPWTVGHAHSAEPAEIPFKAPSFAVRTEYDGRVCWWENSPAMPQAGPRSDPSIPSEPAQEQQREIEAYEALKA